MQMITVMTIVRRLYEENIKVHKKYTYKGNQMMSSSFHNKTVQK